MWPLCCVHAQPSVYSNVRSCGLMYRRKCKAKLDILNRFLKLLLDSYIILIMLSASETTCILVAVRIAYVFMVFRSVSTHIFEYNSEISPTRCNICVFILRNGFTLHVSGDNLTLHQEYICCIWPQVSRLT